MSKCKCALAVLEVDGEIEDLWDDLVEKKFDNASWRSLRIHELLKKVENKCNIKLDDEKETMKKIGEKADKSSKIHISVVTVGLTSKLQDCGK